MAVTDRVYSYHCLGTQFCRDSNNYLGIWVGDLRLACTEKETLILVGGNKMENIEQHVAYEAVIVPLTKPS